MMETPAVNTGSSRYRQARGRRGFSLVLRATEEWFVAAVPSTKLRNAMSDRAHRWTFPRSIRPNAFGWRSSKLAASRLREAMAEVRAVARLDPVLGADGAVGLLERIGPAFEGIDTSSGSLSTATNRAVAELIDLVCAARPAPRVRERWVERLGRALRNDGMGWLVQVGDRFEELEGGNAGAGPVPPGTSLSATFLEFLGDEWVSVSDHPAARDGLLKVGTLVWNAVVFADHCGNPRWLDEVRARVAGEPSRALPEMLVARKRTRFDEHRWLIRDCSLIERDGAMRLRVEAGDPGSVVRDG